MGYPNIQSESNNKNFKRFLIIAIVLTTVLTIAGIFLFPFLGWLINNMRTILIVLIVMCSIAGILLLTWLVPFIVRVASKKTSALNIRLLAFALSLGCITGVNLGLFEDKFWDDHVNGRRTLYRWGDCMVSYSLCYSRFGEKYYEGYAGNTLYRVYDENWEKAIVVISEQFEDSDKYAERIRNVSLSARVYDTRFNYLGELENYHKNVYTVSEDYMEMHPDAGRFWISNDTDNKYTNGLDLPCFYPIRDKDVYWDDDWKKDNSYLIALLVDFLNRDNYTLAEDYGVNMGKKTVVSKNGSHEERQETNESVRETQQPQLEETPTPTSTPQPQPIQPRQPQPMQVWVQCFSCGGNGQCSICLGLGHSLTNPNIRCTICNGTGRCTHCAGQGGHYEVQYY